MPGDTSSSSRTPAPASATSACRSWRRAAPRPPACPASTFATELTTTVAPAAANRRAVAAPMPTEEPVTSTTCAVERALPGAGGVGSESGMGRVYGPAWPRFSAVRLVSFLDETACGPGLVIGDEVVDLTDPAVGLPGAMVELLLALGGDARMPSPGAASPGHVASRSASARLPRSGTPPALLSGHRPQLRGPHLRELGGTARSSRPGSPSSRPVWWDRAPPSRCRRPRPRWTTRASWAWSSAAGAATCRPRALDVVAGFTVVNDVSVRDWQWRTPTMMMGKGFDTHGPTGPWIVTTDELDDPAGPGHPHLGQRRAPPGRAHVRHDLLLRPDDRAPVDGVHPGAGHADHHRHAGRRGRRPRTRPVGCVAGDTVTHRGRGGGDAHQPGGRRARRTASQTGPVSTPDAAPGDERAVEVTPSLRIPLSELQFRFSPSGGPGGQHANKVATRVELRFDVAGSPSLGPGPAGPAARAAGPRGAGGGRRRAVPAAEPATGGRPVPRADGRRAAHREAETADPTDQRVRRSVG